MTIGRYSLSAILLHWAIALLLALEFGLGLRMVAVPQGGATFTAYQLHKSIGITILLLSLARLALRLTRPAPVRIDGGWGAVVARLVHSLFYAVMIAGPLTGWAVVSTARIAIPTRLFWVVPLPHLPIDRAWNGLAGSAHEVIAWTGVALFVLHVAGAVRHHLGVDPHEVVGRMMPAAYDRIGSDRLRSIVTVAVAVVILLSAFLVPRLILTGAPVAEARAGPTRIARTAPNARPTPSASAPAPTSGATPVPPAVVEAAAAPAPAATGWAVLPGGRLGFVATVNGVPVDGTMSRWSADILFDPAALDDSRIRVRIPLTTADTGDASRDAMLRGDDFFANAGPTAVYRSETIRRTGPDRYRAVGVLEMNGRARPVPLDFTLTIAGNIATVEGSARLDRLAFGIGRGEWESTDQIAADVGIAFRLKARRATPDATVDR